MRPRNPYASIDVQTASPLSLVEKLYAAGIRHARRARDAAPSAALVRAEAVDRVLAIVGELRRSLSLEQGGEIAANLDALYAYVSHRMIAANRGEAAGFDDALLVLERLHSAWAELALRPADQLGLSAKAPAV